MKKSLPGKIAIVVVLLMGFIGYTIYSKWQDNHFTVDPESFTIKHSFKGVMAGEYKEFQPLKLADTYGLTKQIHKSVQIPKLHRQIKIHKIWFSPFRLYLLYSINLKKSDKDPKDIPGLQFSNFILHSASGLSLTGKTDQQARAYPGEVYDHQLYRGIVIRPQLKNPDFSNLSPQKFFSTIDQITLKNANLVWKNGNKHKMPLDNLSISTGYHSNHAQVLFTVPLHEKITTGSGQTFRFRRFQAGLGVNLLYFTRQPDNKTISRIYLSITGLGNSFQHFPAGIHTENGRSYISLPPFEDIPKRQLTIQVKNILYATDKSIHFKIAGWNGKKEKFKKKIGTLFGNPFYFSGYHLPGTMNTDNIALSFTWQAPKVMEHPGAIFSLHPSRQLKEQWNHISDKNRRQAMKQQTTGILTIKNDRGESPRFAMPKGDYLQGNHVTLEILLKKQFVKNTGFLSITINHLPKLEKVNAKKLKIQIPKGKDQ